MPGTRAAVAIIGGGFTGAAIAWHLDRLLPAGRSAAITVIEPREQIGAGLAYSSADPAYRINVPASRMNLHPEMPGHFDGWIDATDALRQDPAAVLPDGRRFPQRAVFGRYVADIMAPVLAAGRVLHRRAKALRVDRFGEGYRITLSAGPALEADLVVIATTHPPPSVPGVFGEALAGDPRLITDGTAPGVLDGIGRDERVLIVGTGLTMADIVASLAARGHQGSITAFSRRGQRSAPHAEEATEPFGDFLHQPERRAAALVKRIKAIVATAETRGVPWQAVFDVLRLQGRGIWAALPVAERRRLVRHLRPFWDSRRFRIAPQVHAMMERMLARDQLAILAGAATGVAAKPDAVHVSLRLRGQADETSVAADRIVIATGPSHRDLLTSMPCIRSLAEQGFIRADGVGLGIDTDERGRAVGRSGLPVPTLFIGGPLARGTFGELMGLPEVGRYAADLAVEIAAFVVLRGQRLTA